MHMKLLRMSPGHFADIAHALEAGWVRPRRRRTHVPGVGEDDLLWIVADWIRLAVGPGPERSAPAIPWMLGLDPPDLQDLLCPAGLRPLTDAQLPELWRFLSLGVQPFWAHEAAGLGLQARHCRRRIEEEELRNAARSETGK